MSTRNSAFVTFELRTARQSEVGSEGMIKLQDNIGTIQTVSHKGELDVPWVMRPFSVKLSQMN